MKKTNTALAVTAILVLLAFAIACGGGGGDSVKTYQMKEPVKVGGGTWTVKSVESTKELKRQDGTGNFTAVGMFLLINVSLKNDSGNSVNLTGEEIEVMDDKGNAYTFDSKNNNIYLNAIGKESLTGAAVEAGQTSEGWLIFDISKDAKGLKAKVRNVEITKSDYAFIDLNM